MNVIREYDGRMPTATSRPYVLRARAEQVARTRAAILDATVDLAFEIPLAQATLPRIAERAGTTVQTVLRQFGGRDALLESALEWGARAIAATRPADPERLDATFAAHLEHYERVGDGVLLLLAQERWEPFARRVTDLGRAVHREWVRGAFAPELADAARPRTLEDALVVATDVYVWKLYRRDMGLEADEVGRRMRGLVEAVLAAEEGMERP